MFDAGGKPVVPRSVLGVFGRERCSSGVRLRNVVSMYERWRGLLELYDNVAVDAGEV